MNEKQIRVIDAIEALRADAPKTMAKIGQLVAAGDRSAALQAGCAFRMESIKSAARRTGFEPRAEDVRRVDELGAALEALAADAQTTGPRPFISDATLAKIVRAMYSADTDAAAEADVFDSIDRDVILEAVVNDKHAEALENARGCLAHRTDGASVIAALEEANEEAARNAKRPTQWSDGAEMRRNDALHAAGLALADSTDAARERLKHAIRVVLGRYEGESMGKLADAASAFFGEDFS